MLIIEMPKDYEIYFKGMYETSSDSIKLNYSKNFSGGNDTVEIVITLTPILVAAFVSTLKAILNHIQEMKRIEKENPDEVVIKAKKSDVEVEVLLKSTDLNEKSNFDDIVDKIIKKAIKSK